MRLWEKRKNRRAHVRAQTLAGMAINGRTGDWFKPGPGAEVTTEAPVVKNAYYGTCGKKGAR